MSFKKKKKRGYKMHKTLEQLLKEFGIHLKDKNTLRNPVDIIEDLYIRISPADWKEIIHAIAAQERVHNIFQNQRNEDA
jgi:hypothetical protein